ncbi:MAG TPA: type II secretion system F family protein [Polyangia bacterium]|jgi:tight adherence protein B|nr:type II secretion system F family protein [Polyangia bacterium]
MRGIVIGVVTFAAVFLLEAVVTTLRFFGDKKQDELKRRLQQLGTSDAVKFGLLRQGRLAASPVIDAILRGIPISQRLEDLLEQAEVNITVARLLTYCGVSALLLFSLGVLSAGGPLMSVLLLPMGFMVPIVVVSWKRARRSRKISEQLPDALDMMGRSLRAGHALSSSFKMVASELPAPISLEFARAFEEQNLGLPFEKAIAQMVKRCPTNRDLKIFAVSVIVQKETGGNLVEIIEKIAETIRQRYRFFGKLDTLTAEGRMSSYILGALPILTGLFIGFTNPPYVALLFTTHMGNVIFGFACVSWVIGFVVMNRMAKVTI